MNDDVMVDLDFISRPYNYSLFEDQVAAPPTVNWHFNKWNFSQSHPNNTTMKNPAPSPKKLNGLLIRGTGSHTPKNVYIRYLESARLCWRNFVFLRLLYFL